MPANRARQGHSSWPTHGRSGQVVVLFALSLFVLFAVVGLAVDGGFGLNQLRLAQNAADFASQSGTSQLGPDCNQGTAVPQSTIYSYVSDVVAANIGGSPGVSAFYLDKKGAPILAGSPPAPVAVSITPPASANAPTGACGVETTVTPTWGPFIEQILGVANVSTSATARAILIAPAGIDSLGRFGLHTIYAGGQGKFIVDGDVNDNSAGCNPFQAGNSPYSPNGPCAGTDNYGDTMDAFSNGTVAIYGAINAADPYHDPLDPCYSEPTNPAVIPVPSYPTNPPSSLANHAAPQTSFTYGGVPYPCFATGVVRSPQDINYNALNPGATTITNDPLGYLPTPTASSTVCPGGSLNTVAGAQNYSGGAVLNPGVYTGPVEVSGNATFHSCPFAAPGVYVFQAGLEICPQGSGDVVSSGNAPSDPPGSAFDGGVTLYSATTYQGSASNACPTLGVGQDGDGDGDGPNDTDDDSPVMQLTQLADSGTPPTAQPQNPPVYPVPLWSPMLYGITIGGAPGAVVDLKGPGAGQGQWGQVVLYQNRSTTVPANIGFDAGLNDGAKVTLTGDVYDVSQNSTIVPVSSEMCNFAPTALGGEVVVGNGGNPLVPGYPPCQTQASAPVSSNCATQNCVEIQGVAVVGSFDAMGSANLLIKPPPPPPGAGDVELVQ